MKAAFFDLDRTILPGSSAQVYGTALAEVGVVEQSVPFQSLYFKLYEKFGEDPLSMQLARQGARLFAGRHQDDVRAAGRMAAEVLARKALPFAKAEIAQHRRAGTLVVMATTSPFDLVEPLADELGFDAVIASQYRTVHGVYDGTIDGEFLWNDAKAAAVASWAGANQVDLGQSWAYSDSWYDMPLLELVGQPVPVNPDARLRLIAGLRQWSIADFESLDGVASVAGRELQDFMIPLFRTELSLLASIEVAGAEHIPERGGAIVASNHRSYFDPFALGYLGGARARPMRFLAKKELFDAPLVGQLVAAMGAIPVDRGSGSGEPLEAAARAIDGGELVVVLPEGTIPRGEAFFKAELSGRSGVSRLAAMTGAPVIPVGLWGTEKVWPRSAKVPRLQSMLERPTVSLSAGPPVAFETDDHRERTDQLMRTIVELLPAEGQVDREPTEADLASTQPS